MTWLLLLLGCIVALASAKPSVVSDARSLENALYEFLEAKETVEESLSNVIGTPCSGKLDDAQLDILIGIDITADQDSLDQFTNAVIKQLSRLSIPGKQSKPFKGSCVGVFTYDTAFTDLNDISDCSGFDSIFDTLYHNVQKGTYNQVADLSVPLDHAYDVFADLTSTQSNRKRVLIVASAQGPAVESNAAFKAQLLKEQMNAFVIGVTLHPVDGELRPALVEVVSPGQLLDVYEDKLDDHFTKAFTYGEFLRRSMN
ncbi:hypothetical protein AAVH_23297 [Aphelenchoides avenae]|nr:hypothetical protein AAVH_23297 [Aphelenchus avenae]